MAAARWGFRASLVASGALAAATLLVAAGAGVESPCRRELRPPLSTLAGHAGVWAGWVAGLVLQGVVFTFFPLLADERGMSPAAIGFVFLVLGAGNVAMRLPAGWLGERTRRPAGFAVAALVAASLLTAAVPRAQEILLLALVAAFGALNGLAGVTCSVALAAATTSSTRGLMMGDYSTALYLGLAIGSLAFGPVVTQHGYAVAFAAVAAVALTGAIVAGVVWATGSRRCRGASVIRVPG